MAMPTVQRRTSAPASKVIQWMRVLRAGLGRPLIAVLIAFVLGIIIIAITSSGSLGDRFSTAFSAYYYLLNGSFGNPQNVAYTLAKSTPLIFAGLSVAIAYRAGLFNIGTAGQLAVGAMVAGIIGLRLTILPGWLLVPLMLIGSMLAGALWGAIVGALKAWRGAHEVVTSIMLNWIAFYVASYLVEGPFQAPGLVQQTLPLGQNATLPSLSLLYNQTLGKFLPQIISPEQYTVDAGLLIAFVALIVYWFVTARTTFGYELRVIGQNSKAAKYAGIPLKRNIIVAMALAGAFAGLAGSTRLMGQVPYQLISTSFATDNTGFNAIGVALLGRTTSTGVLLAALLFGALAQSGPYMQLFVNVPGDIIYIMQALVLFSISVEYVPAVLRFLPRFLSRSPKPTLVPNLMHVEAAEVALVTATSNGSELISDDVGRVDPATTSTGQEE